MKFDFSLSGKEVDLILKGLFELPAKESMDLILKFDQEAKAQVKESEQLDDKGK